MSKSLFGADFGNAAMNAAYDMMILNEIEKDDKEVALRQFYKNKEETKDVNRKERTNKSND